MNNVLPHPKMEEFQRQILQRYGGPGGADGGDSGMWQQSVENRLTDISGRIENLRRDMRSDFRWTWGGMVAMFVLLGGMIISAYLLQDSRLRGVEVGIQEIGNNVRAIADHVSRK